MAGLIVNFSFLVTILLSLQVIHGKKGSAFINHIKKTATAPAPSSNSGGQKYVFQTPPGYHGHGHGGQVGYGGYGGYGGFGGFGGFGGVGGFGNAGHIHPVPVQGVKALSIAYDPVSGVPYVCDPKKKDSSSSGGATPAVGASAGGAAPTGKRSEIKKGKIEVEVPDYPPCPDPAKTFPWNCLLGKSTKRECIRARKAMSDVSKRFWPFGGYGYPNYPMRLGYPVGLAAPFGYRPYWG